jgi:orotidine-5'-phosphate decarboxylase
MSVRLFMAADKMSQRRCNNLLGKFGHDLGGVKVHRLYDDARAREEVSMLKDNGAESVFADLKLHDTPDTVGERAVGVVLAGADYLTVHASGGVLMMQAAVASGVNVLAVVFLTSLKKGQFERYYQPNAVVNMLDDALEANVYGFICPPTQVRFMREHLARTGSEKILVVPGTRFADGNTHDQQQVDTPEAVVRAGADWLVIGRMLTAAKNPVQAMARLRAEIEQAELAIQVAGT